ncbi:hypothetical protein BP5796_00724 [Coleophoma crateriformis]|uniref:Rhodopsin domain-containing protein n=1 Tax=Coleophoma crateriformis TaxID=565419 RepID=A0A3D8T941_9HELO|nr:hypothetical protein BP5796_00724 [Coleophoma crateriformis]
MADTLNHDNLQGHALVILVAFPVLATISLALRLYSRSLTKTFAADDIFIIVAAIVYWAETYTSIKLVKTLYIGYHIWDIPAPPVFDSILGDKYSYATQLLYNPILALIKTSILLFLLRLTGQKSAVRKSIYALLVLNNLMMVTVFLLTTFQCLPIAAMWDRIAFANARCINFPDFVTGTAAVSVLTDALVLVLPTWIVYDLQVHKRQKIMLVGILSFGLVTFISGLVRIILLDHFDRHPPADPGYSLLFCLSTIEIGLAFVAACAPALRPIVVKVVPQIFGTNGLRSGPSSKKPSRFKTNTYIMNSQSQRTLSKHKSGIYVEAMDPDLRFPPHPAVLGGISVTKTTEIRWHDASNEKGSSTDSLV